MADSIRRLHRAVLAARTADPTRSRTARLLRAGPPEMARKLAEEAVQVGLDAVLGNRRQVVLESADLIYDLVTLWAGLGIDPQEIWSELDRRELLYGIAEKLPKDRPGQASAA